MRNRLLLLLGFSLLCFVGLTAQRPGVEALEIGRHNVDLMPGGKEADGIVGDFILRNNRVHALISGTQPLRRANMSTEYAAVLQGCLYDLDLRDASNDQLTAFRPGGELGEMSLVRIADDGAKGAGVIEAIRTAAKGDGLYTRHEYRLEQDWKYLQITSTYRNEGTAAKTIAPAAVWKGLADEKQVGEVRVGDSIDSFDKRGYAWGPLKGSAPIEKEVVLKPGEEKVFRIAMAVADSPLAAYGIVASLNGPTGEVSGTVLAPDKSPAVRASLLVSINGESLPGYPDAKGAYSFRLPAGEHRITARDIGRDPLEHTVRVESAKTVTHAFDVSAAAQVRVSITDASGRPSPGKIQFIGVDGTATPDFGTGLRAHGGGHQYQTHNGEAPQQVPPGKYLVRVTRGPEHDLFEQRIEVGKGKTVDVAAKLRRTVDTTGWVSTDYHAHSTPSGDNYTNTDDRIINFAAEQIEFVPTTEHNRIYDWLPHIERLGLTREMKTVKGIELTGSGQHFNAFPLERDAFAQDGGSPRWSPDPRITALLLRTWITPTLDGGSAYDTGVNARLKAPLFEAKPDRWVQANHPTVGEVFFDRNKDGKVDGGFVGFERLIDAAEVWSAEILNPSPTYTYSRGGDSREIPNRTFGWLQMRCARRWGPIAPRSSAPGSTRSSRVTTAPGFPSSTSSARWFSGTGCSVAPATSRV
jgi:hypothetical protein